jgi:hypothetical protein
MRVERCETADAFLDATLAYRASDPFRTNVMSTVATSVIDDPRRYEECFWWLVRDAAGTVSGAAFRTPPHMLVLGPMTPLGAEALAVHAADASPALPGLIGPPQLVGAFVESFASKVGHGAPTFVPTRRDVLYTADRVIMPSVPGEDAVATEADLALAETWVGDFTEEIDGARREPDAASRAALLGVLRAGRLRWWRDRGEIVSMAGHNLTIATPGTNVTRVGPVFTPTQRRRHGYAAGVTAAVTAGLLGAGSTVMLFADEANATSNSVYRSLGYQAIDVFEVASASETNAT